MSVRILLAVAAQTCCLNTAKGCWCLHRQLRMHTLTSGIDQPIAVILQRQCSLLLATMHAYINLWQQTTNRYSHPTLAVLHFPAHSHLTVRSPPPVKAAMLHHAVVLGGSHPPGLPAMPYQALPVKGPLVPKHGGRPCREVGQLLTQELSADLVVPGAWSGGETASGTDSNNSMASGGGLGGLPYTENRENNQSAFRIPSG
jgi:hypothetical protein